MKRGVINFTSDEINVLNTVIDFKKYSDLPLYGKIQSVVNSKDLTEAGVTIELSEDEIESMLDEIMIPVSGEKAEIISIRTKFNQKLFEFRN